MKANETECTALTEKDIRKRISSEERFIRKTETAIKTAKANLRASRKALRFWKKELASLKNPKKTNGKT